MYRCRHKAHKIANILARLPKNKPPAAREATQQTWMAETRAEASKAFDLFVSKYEAKYPKAVACPVQDREQLLGIPTTTTVCVLDSPPENGYGACIPFSCSPKRGRVRA